MVPQRLVRAFMMIICKILANEEIQMAFAKDDEVIEALALEGTEP